MQNELLYLPSKYITKIKCKKAGEIYKIRFGQKDKCVVIELKKPQLVDLFDELDKEIDHFAPSDL